MSAEATVAAPLARRQPSVLAGLAATARPKQWTKNLILFGPLVFAYKLLSPELLLRAVAAFAAFCLVSSAMYVLNDSLDVDSDRQHPTKRGRPLACGQISLGQALTCAAVLGAAGLGLGFTVNIETG